MVSTSLLLTLTPLLVSAESPSVVDLPAWSRQAPANAESFELGGAAASVNVWGRGTEAPRVYFDGFLPALFERTLAFDKIELGDGAVEWIFTGPRGGFTVEIDSDAVRVYQRWYDSFGFNRLDGDKLQASRHPERTWREASVPFRGDLRAVTVTLDHKFGLIVALNGRQAIRQICKFDVSRHQLRIHGDDTHVKGKLVSPEPIRSIVKVDPTKRHQTIIGFGGIATPTAYRLLSVEGKRRWWQLVCEYNLLIQREYPIGQRLNESMDNWDRLADATPHYYGDNFPNGEISDFDYIRTLRKLGGNVWFEFWALPPWARRDWTDTDGNTHQGVADVDKYARAMVRYCEVSKAKAGAPPDVVGIQNEKHQPTPIWHEMTLALRRELDKAGFADVKIHMSDSGGLGGGIQRARAFRESDEVWNTIDFAATHMYDFQARFTDPDAFDPALREWKQLTAGKPFLSTELCVNSPAYQIDSYRLALLMGQLYHKNLTITDASAICYCWTLLNVVQPSYGATRSLCVPDAAHGFVPAASSHQLRVFGAYSRRLHEGMQRVSVESSDPDLLASAFRDRDDRRTVVLLNRSVRRQTVTVVWPPSVFEYNERVDPYHENRPDTLIMGNHETGTVSFNIDPGAMITLSNVPLKTLPAGFKLAAEG